MIDLMTLAFQTDAVAAATPLLALEQVVLTEYGHLVISQS